MHPHLLGVHPLLHGGTTLVCVVALREAASARLKSALSGLTLTGPHIPCLLVTHTFPLPPADFTTALYHGRHREGASLVVPSSTGLTSTSQIKEIEGEFCLPSPCPYVHLPNHGWSTEEMARSTRLEPVPSSNMGLIFPYSAEE